MHTSLDSVLEKGVLRLEELDPDIQRIFSNREETILSILNTYIEEIEYFNPVYKLVGAQNRQELVVKHILDSLSPLGIITRCLAMQNPAVPAGAQEPRSIADVGSGAGLPGIPLAVALPDYAFTLIERMGRRAGFLKNVQAILGLPNVMIEAQDMQQVLPARFSFITFRAFRHVEPVVLKGLFRLLVPSGVLGAYKGRKDTIEHEMGALEHDIGSWEAISCPVPFLDEERHLVLIQQPNTA